MAGYEAMAEETGRAFGKLPPLPLGPQGRQLLSSESGPRAYKSIVARYAVAADRPDEPARGDDRKGAPRLAGDEEPGEPCGMTKEADEIPLRKMMKKQIGYDNVERSALFIEELEYVASDCPHLPSQAGKPLARLPAHQIEAIKQRHAHIRPSSGKLTRKRQHECAVPCPDLDDASRLRNPLSEDGACNNAAMEHESVEAAKVAPRCLGLRIFTRQAVEPFRLDRAWQAHRPARKRMVSATRPGPKDIASPAHPLAAIRIR